MNLHIKWHARNQTDHTLHFTTKRTHIHSLTNPIQLVSLRRENIKILICSRYNFYLQSFLNGNQTHLWFMFSPHFILLALQVRKRKRLPRSIANICFRILVCTLQSDDHSFFFFIEVLSLSLLMHVIDTFDVSFWIFIFLFFSNFLFFRCSFVNYFNMNIINLKLKNAKDKI